MERGSTGWRAAMVLGGAVVAGVVSGGLQSYGVAGVYAVVVGIALAVPLMADGVRPEDVPDPTRDRLRMAAVTGLVALVAGLFAAFALVLVGVEGGILVGAAAGATYAAGLVGRRLGPLRN